MIIAAFNEEKYIEHCLTTLLTQSLRPIELIVVDDGSTDRTWEILQLFKKNYPHIQIFRKKHVEQATARNFGFTKSQGEILVFPDADYYFDRFFVEKLVKPIMSGKVIATYTNDEYVANPDNVWSQCWNINAYLPPGRRVPLDNPVRGNNFRAIARSTFKKAGGFSETGYSNDITVLNKLGVKNAGLAVPGAICYHYNPDTLIKVSGAAYRKGSKGGMPLTLVNFIIYSPLNSFRKALFVAIKENKPYYVIFKIVFDLSLLTGMIVRLFFILVKNDPQLKSLGAKM